MKTNKPRRAPAYEIDFAPNKYGHFRVYVPKELHRNLARRADEEGVSLNALVTVLLARSTATANPSRAPPNPCAGS